MSSPVVNLPAGYTLDQPIKVTPQTGYAPKLPAGYTLDSPSGVDDKSSPIATAAEHWWDQVNPKAAGDAIISLIKNRGQMVPAMGAGLDAPRQAAIDALKKGNYTEAARHALGYLLNAIPGVGSALDKAGNEAQQGQYAAAAGDTAGVATNLFGPEAVKKLPIPSSVRILPGLSNPNPVEAGAVQFLQDRGVPVDAGTATGNNFIRGAQKLADTSPIGAVVSRNAEQATTSAVRGTAADLVAAQTPSISAERHYTDFRMKEADPANMRAVPNGDEDAAGKPVLEDMPMPVPVGMLKSKLQPIFDEMEWMPAADRNASAGYQAIKMILQGPDYVPASTAEIGLGGIKKMAREDVGRNAGLAKFIAPQLQEMIDDSVARTGDPDAVDALQQARLAAAREAGADWLADSFKTAEAEGGYGHTAALWGKWVRLPDDAKKTMFSPQQTQDLNNFFLGTKKLAENPNPSGSGIVANVGGQMALLGTDPKVGVPVILGSGALSRLLHSPTGVQLLTDGLTLPVGSPKGYLTANRILQIVGNRPDQNQQPRQ